MKKIIILLSLVISTSLMFNSCDKGGKSKLVSKTDSLSYAQGVDYGSNILQNLQKDTVGEKFDALLKGFENAMSADDDSISMYYTFGMQIGIQLKMSAENGFMGDSTMMLNSDIIKEAFLATLKKKETQISSEDAATIISTLQQKMQMEQMAKQFGGNKSAGEEFLAKNKTQDGVVTTESGLQYKIIKKGNGPKPSASDRVKVHYKGTLLDGTVFDSSIERGEPAVFPVGGVIRGWVEAIQLMPVGSKWQLFIPQELAYGERDMKTIPPFSALIFEVELLGIEK